MMSLSQQSESEISIKKDLSVNKPERIAFFQQELPSWQFMVTKEMAICIFFVLGIFLIPIGLILLYFSNAVQETVLEYTSCNESLIDQYGEIFYTRRTCYDVLKKNLNANCVCHLRFNLKKNFVGRVYMYYSLINYYQNHRLYVKSEDCHQLLGILTHDVSVDCIPFAKNENNVTIAPCGAIANSMFNDKLELLLKNESKIIKVPLLRTGIAWDTDKTTKFRNPHAPNGLKEAFKGFAKPMAWRQHVYELDEENPDNNGFMNEDFIVWMRASTLPVFRKLYRRIDHSKSGFERGLPKGNYILKVSYFYDVSKFFGKKRMILSTTSILGGKNPFFGVLCIIFAALCFLIGNMMLFHRIKRTRARYVNTDYQRKTRSRAKGSLRVRWNL